VIWCWTWPWPKRGARARFQADVREHCVWVNSLVDRIVSAPIEPAGAVAEPFALWAIERRERMVLLNLGHSFLAERWIVDGRAADETVFQAMSDAALRAELEAVWGDEVLPVFEAEGEGEHARAYLVGLRDRLLNPFLAHRLADIAKDHCEKKRRRIAPVIARAIEMNMALQQRRLRSALSSNAEESSA